VKPLLDNFVDFEIFSKFGRYICYLSGFKIWKVLTPIHSEQMAKKLSILTWDLACEAALCPRLFRNNKSSLFLRSLKLSYFMYVKKNLFKLPTTFFSLSYHPPTHVSFFFLVLCTSPSKVIIFSYEKNYLLTRRTPQVTVRGELAMCQIISNSNLG
jgi:hypothetical protein